MNEDDYYEPDVIDLEIARLVEAGALYPQGVGEDGELLYNYNLDILKEESPALYESHMEMVGEALMSLYEKGLVDIDYDEDLNARFSITEAARAALDSGDYGDVE